MLKVFHFKNTHPTSQDRSFRKMPLADYASTDKMHDEKIVRMYFLPSLEQGRGSVFLLERGYSVAIPPLSIKVKTEHQNCRVHCEK